MQRTTISLASLPARLTCVCKNATNGGPAAGAAP
eukprot:SAG31_NODE_2525_length_5562_cov_2.144243_8_plen_33_part_01